MQEVWWKGNVHLDATQFKSATYTCMPPSFQYIYTLYYWRGTFCDVFELELELVPFKKSCTASKMAPFACRERVLLP